MKFAITTTAILLATASATVSADQRIATFDLGSLDTLDALGLNAQVVGVPKASLPDYLEQYAADNVTDIGGLRSHGYSWRKRAQPDSLHWPPG